MPVHRAQPVQEEFETLAQRVTPGEEDGEEVPAGYTECDLRGKAARALGLAEASLAPPSSRRGNCRHYSQLTLCHDPSKPQGPQRTGWWLGMGQGGRAWVAKLIKVLKGYRLPVID